MSPFPSQIIKNGTKATYILIRRLRKGFQNVRIAQERATLAKCFGDKDNGNVVPPLLLQPMSHFTKCIVLTRDLLTLLLS